MSGEIITLADGRRISVSAVSPAGGGPVAEYVLVGAVEPSGAISRVTQASVSGQPYERTADTGTFTYSGRTVALLGRSSGVLARMTGEAELALDLAAGAGTLTSSASGAGRVANVSGAVTVDVATGALGADALRLDYGDGSGRVVEEAGLDGSLRGANAGFSARYKAKESAGVAGIGVVTGLVDD